MTNEEHQQVIAALEMALETMPPWSIRHEPINAALAIMRREDDGTGNATRTLQRQSISIRAI